MSWPEPIEGGWPAPDGISTQGGGGSSGPAGDTFTRLSGTQSLAGPATLACSLSGSGPYTFTSLDQGTAQRGYLASNSTGFAVPLEDLVSATFDLNKDALWVYFDLTQHDLEGLATDTADVGIAISLYDTTVNLGHGCALAANAGSAHMELHSQTGTSSAIDGLNIPIRNTKSPRLWCRFYWGPGNQLQATFYYSDGDGVRTCGEVEHYTGTAHTATITNYDLRVTWYQTGTPVASGTVCVVDVLTAEEIGPTLPAEVAA